MVNYRKKGMKRTTRRRRLRIPRNLGINLDLKPDYSCKLFKEPIIISNDSTAETKNAFDFTLTDCINYSTWSTVFDQYRINMVVVKFIPVQTQVINRPFDDTTNPGTSVSEIPRFAVSIDRDDSVTPIDIEQLLKRQGTIVKNATQPITLKFVPNRLVQIYNGVTVGYKIDIDHRTFLDCAQPGIPHYGLKCVLEATSPSNCYQYRMETYYYVSFKCKRA